MYNREPFTQYLPKDYDIGTSAKPQEILKIFSKSQIIGKRFPIVHVYVGNRVIEVSTFRGREELDGVIPENFGTPYEDANRRDLTINSLFYDIQNEVIIDYTGGLKDIKNKIIRTIGDPLLRFKQDPVRMLRAIRHSARLSFSITEETWEAILLKKNLIRTVAKERLRDEILKDIEGNYINSWFNLLKKSGLLYETYPFIKKFEKNKAISYKLLNRIFIQLEKSNFSKEERVCIFLYGFLGIINKSSFVQNWRKVPTFEREELLKFFWKFFFTFRFARKFFEESMDIFVDAVKLFYLLYHQHPISKKYRRKKHYKNSLKIAKFLLNTLNSKVVD